MTSTALIAVVVLLLLPVVLIWRLTESKQQTAIRLRRQGQTYEQIGNRLGFHRTTVSKWVRAAA